MRPRILIYEYFSGQHTGSYYGYRFKEDVAKIGGPSFPDFEFLVVRTSGEAIKEINHGHAGLTAVFADVCETQDPLADPDLLNFFTHLRDATHPDTGKPLSAHFPTYVVAKNEPHAEAVLFHEYCEFLTERKSMARVVVDLICSSVSKHSSAVL